MRLRSGGSSTASTPCPPGAGSASAATTSPHATSTTRCSTPRGRRRSDGSGHRISRRNPTTLLCALLVIEHKLLPSKMHAMRTCCRRSNPTTKTRMALVRSTRTVGQLDVTAQISFYASNKKQTSPWFLQCVKSHSFSSHRLYVTHLSPGRGNRSSQKADAGALIARPLAVFQLICSHLETLETLQTPVIFFCRSLHGTCVPYMVTRVTGNVGRDGSFLFFRHQ